MKMLSRIRKTLLLFLALLLVSVACGGGTDDAVGDDTEDGGEPDDVVFALSWLPVADSMGWFSALDKGFFAEEGINANIVRGFGSSDTVQRVASGQVDFGLADLSALLPLRINEDVPLVAVASMYESLPMSTIFRAGEGINEPKDLEGRSIACSAGSASMLLFPAFARETGIDEDQVEWKLSDPGAINPAFASGQTDAACAFISTLPIIQAQTDDELDYFLYRDYGVGGYALMIITHEDTIAENPDLVRRFVRAALRGLEFAVENPDEALEILLTHAPENDPELTPAAWEVDLTVLTGGDVETHGYGYIDPEKMQAHFDSLVDALELDPGEITAEDLYTTEFLP
jgi:NitT/TauT family transport system substrate-binding protein